MINDFDNSKKNTLMYSKFMIGACCISIFAGILSFLLAFVWFGFKSCIVILLFSTSINANIIFNIHQEKLRDKRRMLNYE